MLDPRRVPKRSALSGAGEVSSLAMTFALAVLIGLFGGKWLGAKLGHEQVGLLVGLALGTTAAFLEVVRTARRMSDATPTKAVKHDDGDNDPSGTS